MANHWMGTYLVQGADSIGPWAYTGKGDPLRAQASLHGRKGQTVTILATDISPDEVFVVECAVIEALRATGVRLLNGVSGHGVAKLAPAVALAARLNGVGARQQLTLGQVGPALMLPVNLIHGHMIDDVRQSVYRQWSMSLSRG